MELVSDVGRVESHFSPFGDSVSVSARLEHGFGPTRSDYLVTRLKWKLCSVRLGIVLLLMQDWCTVCVEHTVGSKIVSEPRDGTPR
jgi:hypothetical protein